MNGCHHVVEELVELAFSGRPAEYVLERATLLLRAVIESGPEVPPEALDGFRPELLERNARQPDPAAHHPIGSYGEVTSPVVFNAGREAGRAIGQALQGKIDRNQLRTTLRALLCK